MLIAFGTIETPNEPSSWKRILETHRCLPLPMSSFEKKTRNSPLNTDHFSLYHVSLGITYKFKFPRGEDPRSRERQLPFITLCMFFFFKSVKSCVKATFWLLISHLSGVKTVVLCCPLWSPLPTCGCLNLN